MGKRAFDLVGASLLLVVAVPFILGGALVSAVTYRRWPLFRQARVGRNGRVFHMLKVRTLDPRTPPSLPKDQLVAYPPRPGCRFLRAHHLDELPQLVNVLGGSMSLVGPRPEMVELHSRMSPEFARRRVSVRPGITGLWQVSRAVESMIDDDPAFDLYYIAERDLRLDLWILWRTFTGLVGRPPIESLDDLPAWAAPTPVLPPEKRPWDGASL